MSHLPGDPSAPGGPAGPTGPTDPVPATYMYAIQKPISQKSVAGL